MSINLTQAFLYETDDLKSFEKVLDAMVRICTHGEKPSRYSQLFVTTTKPESFNDGKSWIQKEQKYFRPRFLHVCSIGDYKDAIKEGDQTFERYADLVQRVMEHVRNADVEKFFAQCGYDPTFNHFDGKVEVGYRVNKRSLGGWNFLDISLCHIYYGK